MVRIERTNPGTWTVHVARDMSSPEVKRIVGYRLTGSVAFDLKRTGGDTLITFSDEAQAREFARWVEPRM